MIARDYPEVNNPLALWDRQTGHSKKGLIAGLKESFAAVDGFVPFGHIQQSPVTAADTVAMRPRLHLSTRRYTDTRFIESKGRDVIVDKGQEIVLIDDQLRGTPDHIVPVIRIPRQHERKYTKCLRLAETVMDQIMPDTKNIAAYRSLSVDEIARRAATIGQRVEKLAHLGSHQSDSFIKTVKPRDAANAQRSEEAFREFGL
jgi:hypothetical protein